MKRREVIGMMAQTGVAAPLASIANQTRGDSLGGSKVVADKNLVIFTSEMGFFQDIFNPTGNDLNSAPLIKCLKDHHEHITVFNQICQPELKHGHLGNQGLLTLNTNQRDGPYISLDQFVAGRIQQVTRYKTVHMGGGALVWDKNSQKLPSLMNQGPKAIYDKLFTREASSEALKEKLEILNTYQGNIARNVYATDSFKMAIQELEDEIATDMVWGERPIPKVEMDTALHLADNHERGYIFPVAQHLELVHQGLKHQRGQVFVVSPPYIDKTLLDGVKGSYHGVGHGASKSTQAFESLLLIEQYIMEGVSGFLSSLKESKLLNDTIVLVMGSFCDAGRHSRKYTPALVAGGGFKHQGIVECGEEIRLSHLYVSVLHQMGIDVDEFATFKGDVDRILL